MKNLNNYHKAGIIGIGVTFLLQILLSLAVDPYFASILSSFYPVWIIVLVVGWRKARPRQ
ncbi:hypothetical protein BH24BAC1_BH24BAC1_23200 [soil metagenome]